MAESESSPVFMFDNSDPEMQRAYEQARETFRYLWREVAWERRRIVPALDLACVKVPFTDGEPQGQAEGTPQVEHMWVSDVDFDGEFVSGVLVNAPNWLKSVKRGTVPASRSARSATGCTPSAARYTARTRSTCCGPG